VKTLSGYLTTDRGDEVAFTILSNNFTVPAKKVTDAIDAIAETIVEDAPSPK
jgi:D-alanyl-D-alanine carboxypeptidase